jgi:hypothetical protein
MNQKTLLAIIALLTVLKVGTCVDFPNIFYDEAALIALNNKRAREHKDPLTSDHAIVTFLTDCFTYSSDLAILKKNVRNEIERLTVEKYQGNNMDQAAVKEEAAKEFAALLDSKTEAFNPDGIDAIYNLINADIEAHRMRIDVGDHFKENTKLKLTFFDGSHPFVSNYFKLFGIFSDDEGKRKAFAKEVITRYRLTSYHNICHGIYVGMAAASAYLLQNNLVLKDDGLHDEKDLNNKIEDESKWMTLKSLFFAGLSHDLAHSGLTNARQDRVLNPDKPRITGLLHATKDFGCGFSSDNKLSETQTAAIARLLNMEGEEKNAPDRLIQYSNFVLNLMREENYNSINRQELEKLSQEFVDRIFEIKSPNLNKEALKETVCNSAEHMQQIAAIALYDMAVEIDKTVFSGITPGIIARSILHTHMALPKEDHLIVVDIHEKIVHLVDLLNTFPENEALTYQALRGLMIEFITEFRNYNGCEMVIPPWKDQGHDTREINAEQLTNQKAAIERVLGNKDQFDQLDPVTNVFKKFINMQEGFFKFVVEPDIAKVFKPFVFLEQLVKNPNLNSLRVQVLDQVYRETGFVIPREPINLIFI